MPSNDHFRPSYAQHRARFLDAARGANCELREHLIEARGPGDAPLAIDEAWLGPADAERVLFLLSGIHGVEGYAGSAIQASFLYEDAASLALPEGGAVLVVHAANPFGFAWSRRVNESNVDINRNFVDHASLDLHRADYMKYDELINPRELAADDAERFMQRAAELIEEVGFDRAQAIVSEGQYEQPLGLAYGGAEEESSARILREIVRRRLSRAREVHLIDLHTGLGESGRYTMLSDHDEHTREHARLLGVYPEGRVECPRAGGSISAALSGESGEGMAAELPGVFFWGAAAEFGTTDPLTVFRALRLENWCWHHGEREGPGREPYARALLDAFRPDTEKWKSDVLGGGREVIGLGWRALFA